MPNVNDAQRIQMLQRNKSQLELRVKNLLEEMQEIRKQKEYAVTEADRVQRSAHQATCGHQYGRERNFSVILQNTSTRYRTITRKFKINRK